MLLVCISRNEQDHSLPHFKLTPDADGTDGLSQLDVSYVQSCPHSSGIRLFISIFK